MMDNEADMAISFVSHENWVIYVTDVWPDIDMSKSKAANSCFYGLQSPRCAINKNQI